MSFKINQNITIKIILSIEKHSKFEKEKKRTKKTKFFSFSKLCYFKNIFLLYLCYLSHSINEFKIMLFNESNSFPKQHQNNYNIN